MNAIQKDMLIKLMKEVEGEMEDYRALQCIMSAHNFQEEARILGLKYEVCNKMYEIVSETVDGVLNMEGKNNGEEE